MLRPTYSKLLAMPDRNITQQAKTRLRRIEGQVRGIQRMLDRMDEDATTTEAVTEQTRRLLAEGKPAAEVARAAGIPRQRVAQIEMGRETPEGELCDNLLTQIMAVRAAVEQVGLLIVELHLECCVLDGLEIDEEKMRELRASIRSWSRLKST